MSGAALPTRKCAAAPPCATATHPSSRARSTQAGEAAARMESKAPALSGARRAAVASAGPGQAVASSLRPWRWLPTLQQARHTSALPLRRTQCARQRRKAALGTASTSGSATGAAAGAAAPNGGGPPSGAGPSLREARQARMASKLACIWRRLSRQGLPSARVTSGQGQRDRAAVAP